MDSIATVFRRYLAGETAAAPENWPFQALLAAARAGVIHRTGASLPETPTAYAELLRELSRGAIRGLVDQSEFWQGHLRAVFLTGSAATGLAYPFYAQVEGEVLPPETARLFEAIYTWLFTFLGKGVQLNDTRFLDADISSELLVHLYLTNPERLSPGEAEARLREVFLKTANFIPPFLCTVYPAETLDGGRVLSGYCIYGWEQALETLRGAWESRGEAALLAEGEAAAAALTRELLAPAGRVSAGDRPLQDVVVRIVAAYRRAREEGWPTVSLSWQERPDGKGSEWHADNEAFFQLLESGRYDRLLVEDATRDLRDEKGSGKDNPFTISRVLGLEVDGRLTPARDMVLKLRGMTAYRGDINNSLDLLKEYASYAYIHKRLGAPSPYVLEIGPLLLTCEKLAVPFDREETRHWIGFFMQALHPPDQGRAFTSRVRFVTDFWAPQQGVERVLRAARRSGLSLDRESLTAHLCELAVWFWTRGISLTYCDLVLYLDEAARTTGVRLIDLERLTYGELVDENHLLLDVMIDIKARLRKEPWYPVLNHLFLSRNDPEGFRSFLALRPYLYPKSRRRQLLLGVFRGLHSQASRLKPPRGQAIWAGFLRLWARLSGLRLPRP